MRTLIKTLARMAGTVIFAAVSLSVYAQSWPTKPITFVVPYPPGGSTDIIGRTIAQRLGPALGTTVIVDNKPGATGQIGSAFVARSTPDGYTILHTTIGPQAIVPNFNHSMQYDPVTSFEPITLVGTIPHVLIVSSESPYKTVKDLIAAAKAKPGYLTFASGGNGTILQMQGELLEMETGIDMIHVPYKGDAPGIQDVLGGQVTMMFVPIAGARTYITSGRLRALAVTSARRLESLPTVPTMEEAGVPGFVVEQWQAIYVPAHTPAPIVQRLYQEIVRILKDPEIVKRFESLGVHAVGSAPRQLTEIQKADTIKWAKVIKAAGIKLD